MNRRDMDEYCEKADPLGAVQGVLLALLVGLVIGGAAWTVIQFFAHPEIFESVAQLFAGAFVWRK